MNSDALEQKLKTLEERVSVLESKMTENQVTVPSTQIKKKLSIKEFLLNKKPKSEIETTFYIAYFLEKLEFVSSFNVEDIRLAYKAAKVPSPKNINDTVNKNISKGYFMDAGEKEGKSKSWTLTASGERQYENSMKEK